MSGKRTSKKRKQPIFQKLVQKIASKWVAGHSVKEALESAKKTNAKGMGVILNYLGEHIIDEQKIEAHVNEYLNVLQEMDRLKIDGSITPKLTQIGLDNDYELCEKNTIRIVEKAKQLDRFVWIDIESSSYLKDTIQLYFTLLERYDKVGVAFQAYLKRGGNFLVDILMNNGKVRLVKGAYSEDSSVAYQSKKLVDRNYLKLMKMLFEQNEYFAIATHDQVMIEEAIRLNEKYQREFEFQMLRGIRDELKPSLIQNGFRLSEYIPYGENVAEYSVRRIKEKPSNILLLARSLF